MKAKENIMKQHDDSSKGSFKSGGQKIDDHSFWAGGASKESPLPMNSKMKQYTSAEGAANVSKYEDTTEAIKAGQMEGSKKIKAHPMKQPDYRN
jgi:hypothetical protein